ncbi:hypothetical protein J3R82DRAFT_8946 [Butyriboletus roseoflavus]|nr:hypothetical protein J3R82DRAFT_8946 [Butyriboletus roseoflavus]
MESNYGSMYHGIQLTPLPVAYRPDRRIRATDTDAHGRRLDPTMENWDGKDALPAYDNFDRPPKYVEAGWTHGGPPLPAQQSTVTPSPQGDHSGIAHPNIADGAIVDPFYHTYAVAGITHETEARSPHDLASS